MTKPRKTKKTTSQNRKYNILHCLNQLPFDEHKIAKNKLPIALEVSRRTFERWVYLKDNENLEIPVNKIAIIAKYLGCTIEDLINTPIPQFNTATLQKLEDESLALELGLVR